MKDLVVKAWGFVPNKGRLLYIAFVCSVTIAVLGGSATWFTFKVPVWNSETLWEMGYRHTHQHSIFDNETIQANTRMAGLNRDTDKFRSELTEIKTVYYFHQIMMEDSLDDNDNWKNDAAKKRFENREQELKRDMKVLEDKIKGVETSFYSDQQFAQRDR